MEVGGLENYLSSQQSLGVPLWYAHTSVSLHRSYRSLTVERPFNSDLSLGLILKGLTSTDLAGQPTFLFFVDNREGQDR